MKWTISEDQWHKMAISSAGEPKRLPASLGWQLVQTKRCNMRWKQDSSAGCFKIVVDPLVIKPIAILVGFNPSEKYESVGIIIPNIWKNKQVPNHQVCKSAIV